MSHTITTNPVTGMAPEPRKPLRKRTWFWVTGGLIAVAVIGGIAAGASGGSKPAASPSASAPASQAPSSPPAPSASDTPSATAPSPMDTWCTGTGYSQRNGCCGQIVGYIKDEVGVIFTESKVERLQVSTQTL